MSAEHPRIKISAHLEDRRGVYHILMSWQDHNKKRCRRCISTGLPLKGNKKRAEEMMKTVKGELEARLNDECGDDQLFADFMEKWLLTIKKDLKQTTYGNHQSMIKRVIGPYFRELGLYVSDVMPEHIQKYYDKQLEHVKATTVHKYHNILSRVFAYAIEEKIIKHSPIENVKRPKAVPFVAKFLKESEAVELFEKVNGHKLELGVIMATFYGLRRAEIVGLRWESIDFEQNTITIEHSVTVAQVDGKKQIVKDDSLKTKSSFRTLPLVPAFREKLLVLKKEQEHNRRLCGNSYNNQHRGYAYVDVMGNLIRPDYLTAEFPKFMEKNGFRRLRFHDLRHSCASLLLANGISLKEIQEWLGHSNYLITANVYAHLQSESKKAAAKSMTWVENTSLGQMISPMENGAPQTQSQQGL